MNLFASIFLFLQNICLEIVNRFQKFFHIYCFTNLCYNICNFSVSKRLIIQSVFVYAYRINAFHCQFKIRQHTIFLLQFISKVYLLRAVLIYSIPNFLCLCQNYAVTHIHWYYYKFIFFHHHSCSQNFFTDFHTQADC